MIQSMPRLFRIFMITYCKKWPGNPELYEGKSNNINKTERFPYF